MNTTKRTKTSDPSDNPFDGSWVYIGTAHPWARDLRVRIVGVIRDQGSASGRVIPVSYTHLTLPTSDLV